MALSPKKGRGRPKTKVEIKEKKSPEELKITRLVTKVRETQDESAFLQLQEYLGFYVKLFGKKYRIPGCDSAEIEQECLYALRYKAVEDFNSERGKFRSFAILCIRRHLFSIIKMNKQHKRIVLNESLSLDVDRGENSGGENLSLINLVVSTASAADDILAKDEFFNSQKEKLAECLSPLEREVLRFYLQQYSYEEIVEELKKILPDKNICAKTCDNALSRTKLKARELAKILDFEE